MDGNQVPPEITALIEKGSTTGLTDAERRILAGFVVSNRGLVDDAALLYINQLATTPSASPDLPNAPVGNFDWVNSLAEIGEHGNTMTRQPGFGDIPPTDTTGPDPAQQSADAMAARGMAPSVAEQVAATQGQGPPTIPVLPAGVGGLAATAADALMPDPTRSAPVPGASAPSAALEAAAMKAGASGGLLDRAASVGVEDPTLAMFPDRGGGRDRNNERGDRHDYKVERDAMMGQMSPESAFAGVDPAMLELMASDPHLAARRISASRGGSGAGANLLAPQLAAAMDLNQTGVLAGRRKLGGYESAGDQLGAAEAFVNEQGPGSYVDPQSLYRQTFRNVRHTKAEDMFTGEGVAGDIPNQMATTAGALMAAAGASMTPDAQANLQAKLNAAQEEYLLGVADGSISPELLSYPEWLRTEKKARRWIGPGLSQERVADAF